MSRRLTNDVISWLRSDTRRLCSPWELELLLDEVREHRATMARLAEWANELRGATRVGVGPFLAQELENRIAGVKP